MKINAETRAILQSARAKNRKAAIALGTAGAMGVTVPKHVIAKMAAIDEWLNAQITPAKKAETEVEVEAA